MTTVSLIGADVPFDELSRRAGVAQDEPVESVKQARYLPGDIYRKQKYSLKITADRPERMPGESYAGWAQRFVFSALVSQGLRMIKLNPEVELLELANQLEAFYPSAVAEVDPDARVIHPYDAFHGGDKAPAWLDWDQVPTQARNAAQSALEKFDPEKVAKHKAMSAKGGRAGKKYTREDYVATQGMRKVDIARRLNISRPTVDKMIKEFENEKLESDDD